MSDTTHQAKKRFGQNFLHDKSVINRIIAAFNPQADDHVIEIGPGLGALTGPLLAHLNHLDVIELDRDLVQRMEQTLNSEQKRVTIHQEDALKFDFSSLGNKAGTRVIGNLPYNISTPLLFHILEYRQLISDMLFMLQKEVVERICASPGNKNYGRLSVMIQYACDVNQLFTIKPGAFRPAPRVDSAIVHIQPKDEIPYQAQDHTVFSTIVKDAFSQRRKTLRNAIRKHLDEAQIRQLDIDPTLRPENLCINDFVRLANAVTA